MKQKYIEAVNEAVNIIKKDIKKEKLNISIFFDIEQMLIEKKVGTRDVEYFNRFYFVALKNKTIVKFIRDEREKYGIIEYEKLSDKDKKMNKKATFKNISKFGRKYEKKKGEHIMKQYSVDWRDCIEDWLDNFDDSKKIFVKAETKEEAICKFLDGQFEFLPTFHIRDELFLYFCGLLSNDEENEIIQTFSNVEGVKLFANELRKTINLDAVISDMEADINSYEINTLSNKFFSLLSEKDKKYFFYEANRHDVCCNEEIDNDEYIRQEREKRKNLIVDVQDEDIMILNCLLRMIRSEKKECYCLDADILVEYGIEREEAYELLRYLCHNGLNIRAHFYTDAGCTISRLFAPEPLGYMIGDVSQYSVRPDGLLYRLADAGYNFDDGMNVIAKQVCRDYFCD